MHKQGTRLFRSKNKNINVTAVSMEGEACVSEMISTVTGVVIFAVRCMTKYSRSLHFFLFGFFS